MRATNGTALEAGALIGRYRIVRPLGSGGMGEVYEALHVDLDKRVAIKTLRHDRVHDAEARARFLREGKAAVKVRHPHVVEVSDVGEWNDTLYLVMELLDGEDLAAWASRVKPCPLQALADLMLPVLAAVAAAHEEGVLHRDLKPSNIFLATTRDGAVQPKVLDFGIASMTAGTGEKVTHTHAIIGTPAYMSPEQTRGMQDLTAASDQYALGVVLYECATGRLPIEPGPVLGMLHRIGRGQYPTPRELRPDLPEGFERVVLRAMALDPSARFASVRELGRALIPFAGVRGRMQWEGAFTANLARGTSADGVLPAAPPHRSPATTLGGSVRERAVGALRIERRAHWAFASVLAGALVAWGARSLVARSEHAAYEVVLEVSPPSAALTLDGVPVGTGAIRRTFAVNGAQHVLRVTAPGHASREVVFVNGPPAVTRVALVALPRSEPSTASAAPPSQSATHVDERRFERARARASEANAPRPARAPERGALQGAPAPSQSHEAPRVRDNAVPGTHAAPDGAEPRVAPAPGVIVPPAPQRLLSPF